MRAWPASARKDHPRIRGEHRTVRHDLDCATGSSPHTRGALSVPEAPPRAFPYHPRIRGEHSTRTPATRKPNGSSPHTRGAHLRRLDGENERGIIPAYAGSTSLVMRSCCLGRDHPRIRGEHGLAGRLVFPGRGSSPHTRGAHLRAGRSPDARGIIPAYAGSTSPAPAGQGPAPDHPRIRGEHANNATLWTSSDGSSPHTRGARTEQVAHEPAGGIIPAYAGSTPDSAWARRRHADHPRIRGEHPVDFLDLAGL